MSPSWPGGGGRRASHHVACRIVFLFSRWAAAAGVRSSASDDQDQDHRRPKNAGGILTGQDRPGPGPTRTRTRTRSRTWTSQRADAPSLVQAETTRATRAGPVSPQVVAPVPVVAPPPVTTWLEAGPDPIAAGVPGLFTFSQPLPLPRIPASRRPQGRYGISTGKISDSVYWGVVSASVSSTLQVVYV